MDGCDERPTHMERRQEIDTLRIARRRVATAALTVTWLAAMYLMWVAPSSFLASILVCYGLFGPIRGNLDSHFWWLEYWVNDQAILRINPPGLILTCILSLVVSWLMAAGLRTILFDTPFRLAVWKRIPALHECPRCGYILEQSAAGCPECGWGRK